MRILRAGRIRPHAEGLSGLEPPSAKRASFALLRGAQQPALYSKPTGASPLPGTSSINSTANPS